MAIAIQLQLIDKYALSLIKEQFLEGIKYAISCHKTVPLYIKNVIWQEVLAALNRRQLLSSEEVESLNKKPYF